MIARESDGSRARALTGPYPDEVQQSDQTARPTRVFVWAQLALARDLTHAEPEVSMLRDLGAGDAFEVAVHVDTPWEDLPALIEEFDPHVFHFVGHGRGGELVATRVQSHGGLDEGRVKALALSRSLRKHGRSLEGVFLNGCETSRWAPHFIPSGGWFIGANRKVDDAAAMLFAEEFYKRFTPSSTNADSFESAVATVSSMDGFSEPPVVRWVEDADPEEFLFKIFDRAAFYEPTCNEASMKELHDAVEGAKNALQSGRLRTRHDVLRPTVVHCTRNLDAAAVDRLRRLLRDVSHDLANLRREFNDTDVRHYNGIQVGRRPRFLYLADRLDSSRNQVIEALWEILPLRYMLDEIRLSSSLLGPGWKDAGPL